MADREIPPELLQAQTDFELATIEVHVASQPGSTEDLGAARATQMTALKALEAARKVAGFAMGQEGLEVKAAGKSAALKIVAERAAAAVAGEVEAAAG